MFELGFNFRWFIPSKYESKLLNKLSMISFLVYAYKNKLTFN